MASGFNLQDVDILFNGMILNAVIRGGVSNGGMFDVRSVGALPKQNKYDKIVETSPAGLNIHRKQLNTENTLDLTISYLSDSIFKGNIDRLNEYVTNDETGTLSFIDASQNIGETIAKYPDTSIMSFIDLDGIEDGSQSTAIIPFSVGKA